MRGIFIAVPDSLAVAFAVSLALASCGFETRNWDFCSTGTGVGACGFNHHCETQPGVCVDGCVSDADCNDGLSQCDTTTHQCVSTCAVEGDCPDVGVTCADGGSCSSEAASEGAGEAAADAATEAGLDAAQDSGPDVSADTRPDVGPDVGMDVSPDVSPDVGSEVGADVGQDVAPDVRLDAPIDAGPDATVDAGPCGGPCATGTVCNLPVNRCTQCTATVDNCASHMSCDLTTFTCMAED